MRLHKNLVLAVIDALAYIFNEGQYADKVVEQVLKRDKRWGARDRGFIAETTYEIVRWKRLYAEIAVVKPPFSKPDLFRLFTVWAVLRGIALPDWKEFGAVPARKIKGRFDELSKIRKYRESVPDWLDELGTNSLGDSLWTAELAALNKTAAVVLRVNRLKATVDTVLQALQEEGIETQRVKERPDALQLIRRANVFRTTAFTKGFFEVQDASSQLVAPFLEVTPGQRVVDACAGAGGKTLHLAALMQNKGQLLALDIYSNKLRELKKRAKRNGVHNLETRVIDSTKVIKKLYGKTDSVLIDAPCTGLGVLRRNPDAKWKLQPEFLTKITQTQQDILKSYSKMLRSGGKLVYATCSILPQENANQVQAFLGSEEGSAFSLAEERHVYASKSGFDGFYMARMQRK